MADLESPTLLAASVQRKPHMSITLPRNFAPLGLDGCDDPKTPDQTFAELKLPPPPQHHSTQRIRRSRVNVDNFQIRNNALPATLFASEIAVPSSARSTQTDYSLPSAAFSSDVAIPSIESPGTVTRPFFQHSITDPTPSARLQLPSHRQPLPRTPPAQTETLASVYRSSVWDMQRAASVCSDRSDSSSSSVGTFTTRPTSFDGSATSPDIDLCDPFSPSKVNIIPDTPTRRSKKLRVTRVLSKDKVQWSIEMDNHLFNMYQIYLTDPSVTPFKTVPGSIPPTGVCHRVARRAKELWPKASRISKPIVQRYKMRNVFEDRRAARDQTPEPNDFLKTNYATDGRGVWPSEKQTRKRLKQLCKEKYTISAHYQRLRESRSPSPFADQFLRRPASSRMARSSFHDLLGQRPSTSYATRELGISLMAASGATAPLAQLVTGESPSFEQHSDDFFNTPLGSDKMNLSPPSGLGIAAEPDKLHVASSIPRLASPFNYSTWNGPVRSNQEHKRRISQNQFDTMHATGSRLLSPFHPEPDVSQNVNKRRAQHNLEDELSPSGSNIEGRPRSMDMFPMSGPPVKPEAPQELVFTGAGDLNQRRIRVRGRGATLGVNNREQIERLFNPPTIQAPAEMGNPPPVPAIPSAFAHLTSTKNSLNSHGLAPPEQEKRLGSPFELDHNKRSQRARAPRHVPSMSDPFISYSAFTSTPGQASNMSIGERLAVFNNLYQLSGMRPPQQEPGSIAGAGSDDPFS